MVIKHINLGQLGKTATIYHTHHLFNNTTNIVPISFPHPGQRLHRPCVKWKAPFSVIKLSCMALTRAATSFYSFVARLSTLNYTVLKYISTMFKYLKVINYWSYYFWYWKFFILFAISVMDVLNKNVLLFFLEWCQEEW